MTVENNGQCCAYCMPHVSIRTGAVDQASKRGLPEAIYHTSVSCFTSVAIDRVDLCVGRSCQRSIRSVSTASKRRHNDMACYTSLPTPSKFKRSAFHFQNQYRLSRKDPDRVLQCRRYKEEQRRAAASLLILLIVAQAVAVTFQSSMHVDMAHLRVTKLTKQREELLSLFLLWRRELILG